MSCGTLDTAGRTRISTTRLSLSLVRFSLRFVYARPIPSSVRHPVAYHYAWFGLLPFRSPLLRKSFVYFLFLRVLRCFSSPGSPRYTILFVQRYYRIINSEFPHSEICGLSFICNYPQLIAACHVLLRRLVPRHPPYALLRLIVYVFQLSLYLRTFVSDLLCLFLSKFFSREFVYYTSF